MHRRTQISHVNVFVPLAKGTQNGGEKVRVCVSGTVNSHFFVTGQSGVIFREKVKQCPLLNFK